MMKLNTHVDLYKGIPINITGLNVPEGRKRVV